ncbi:MAG: hypothetical protein ACFKPT_14910 [Gloeotrichia echinulata GP01]
MTAVGKNQSSNNLFTDIFIYQSRSWGCG